MIKNCLIQVRISSENLKIIKEFGSSPTKIFYIGFEKWIENIPSELQKKAEYYQNLYIQCNDKLSKCNDNVMTIKSELDIICNEYLNFGRPIENPEESDLYWLKSRIEKHNLSISTETFLKRCKELKGKLVK